MEYKVAVATSDGIHIDKHFGQTDIFWIYQVKGDGSYIKTEERSVIGKNPSSPCKGEELGCDGCRGHLRNGSVETVRDCRCVFCSHCGFGAEKELNKLRISVFALEKRLDEVMSKVINYYRNSDAHVSVAGRTGSA